MAGIPERLGVVDVVPNSESGETFQNSEPSLAVGTGTNLGKLVLQDRWRVSCSHQPAGWPPKF